MKKLPIGVQNFREIVEGDYLLVDKTAFYHRLIDAGKCLFLSRPRRFGKSVMLSTLREIFQGNKELFRGLWIENKLDWEGFDYPVIHIDYSLVNVMESTEVFESTLSFMLQNCAFENEMELRQSIPMLQFIELIRGLHRKTGKKVVVLVDECDKAVVDVLHEKEKANRNREFLKSFYGVLKPLDPHLRFVMLTGVSKIAKDSIFSGLNNLLDISMHPDFNDIVGFTDEELNYAFGNYLERLQQHLGVKKKEMLRRIRFRYDGYGWGGKNRLYNPFSILNLFENRTFGNYWFASGTPTFLINLIKKKKWEVSEFENAQISDLDLDSFDLDSLGLNSLLFQTGYLTVKKLEPLNVGHLITLTYPNEEVKLSFLTHLTTAFIDDGNNDIQANAIQLKRCLETGDMHGFMNLMRHLFGRIPPKLHSGEEKYYHSLFYMILSLMGVEVQLERMTDKGIVDGVLEMKERVYVIEFKFAKQGKMKTLLDKAIQQIEDRKYYESFLGTSKKIILLGIGFLKKEIDFKIKNLK